ncbi:hypothetical protein [Arthrobacter sp. AD-310]
MKLNAGLFAVPLLLVFASGCASSEAATQAGSSPSPDDKPVVDQTGTFNKITAAVNDLYDGKCSASTDKKIAKDISVRFTDCKGITNYAIYVADNEEGFEEAVAEYMGTASAVGNNWLITFTPTELAKSSYIISGGKYQSDINEADHWAEKLDGWSVINPDRKAMFSARL